MSEPHFHPAADGTGPGLNSGYILEEMIGGALKQNCHLAAWMPFGSFWLDVKASLWCFGSRCSNNDGCFPSGGDADITLKAVHDRFGVSAGLDALQAWRL